MAGISFSDDANGIWIVAGWAFRQVLSDLGPRVLDDAEMLKELAEAEAIGFLDVGSLNRDCAIRMSQAIEDLVSGILAGSIRSGIADNFPDFPGEETRSEYFLALNSLVEASRGGTIPHKH